MPNYVRNKVTVTGKDIDSFKELVKGMDFDKIRPMAESLSIGSFNESDAALLFIFEIYGANINHITEKVTLKRIITEKCNGNKVGKMVARLFWDCVISVIDTILPKEMAASLNATIIRKHLWLFPMIMEGMYPYSYQDWKTNYVSDIKKLEENILNQPKFQELVNTEAKRKEVIDLFREVYTLYLPEDYDYSKFYNSDVTNPFGTIGGLFAYGTLMYQNYVRYGARNWYDWRIKNWGTKWNAMHVETTEEDIDGVPTLCYQFDTAWCPPDGIIAYLEKDICSLDIELTWEYADEDIGSNCGVFYRYEDAEEISYESKDGDYDFACEMWDMDPDEFKELLGA